MTARAVLHSAAGEIARLEAELVATRAEVERLRVKHGLLLALAESIVAESEDGLDRSGWNLQLARKALKNTP